MFSPGMSKAVGTVTKTATGGLIGGALGGGPGSFAGSLYGAKSAGLPGLPSFVQPGFRGKERDINERAFNLEYGGQLKNEALEQRARAEKRGLTAQRGQSQLISQLQQQARGEGPSIAEAQLKAASDRSLAQQLAAAQSGRGGQSTAAIQRQLAQQQATSGQEIAQQAAIARMQEQQSAQGLLANVLGQEQQLADQLQQSYLAQGFSIDQAQQQARADLEKLKTQQFLAAQGLTAEGVAGEQKQKAAITGGLLKAGGGLLSAGALSDKNEKTNIKPLSGKSNTKKKKNLASSLSKNKQKTTDEPMVEKTASKSKLFEAGGAFGESIQKGREQAAEGQKRAGRQMFNQQLAAVSDKTEKKSQKSINEKDMNDFLDKIKAYSYEYKNPNKEGAGPGKQVGVMAQDLMKSKVGKQMVTKAPTGELMVDFGKGFGAVLAAQAALNEKLKKLESSKKKKKS